MSRLPRSFETKSLMKDCESPKSEDLSFSARYLKSCAFSPKLRVGREETAYHMPRTAISFVDSTAKSFSMLLKITQHMIVFIKS